MKLTKGADLTPEQRRLVFEKYVHRNTLEQPFKRGLCIPVLTDKEWIERLSFYITKSGRLSLRHKHCEPDFLAD